MRVPFRVLPAVLALALVGSGASAQDVRLNFFGGYTFQDKFPMGGSYYGYTYSEGRIAESSHFGGSIEFDIRPNKAIELSYQTQATQGYFSGPLGDIGEPYDVNINYIMLGGMGYAPFSDAVHGYGGFSIGCGYMTGDANETKFAWGGKLGLKINASETVGIKLGAQLMSPVQGAGGGFYFGTGGASAGVSTYSSVYQFGFTGGLCFTLPRQGRNAPKPQPRSSAPPPPPAGTGVPPPPPPPPPRP